MPYPAPLEEDFVCESAEPSTWFARCSSVAGRRAGRSLPEIPRISWQPRRGATWAGPTGDGDGVRYRPGGHLQRVHARTVQAVAGELYRVHRCAPARLLLRCTCWPCVRAAELLSLHVPVVLFAVPYHVLFSCSEYHTTPSNCVENRLPCTTRGSRHTSRLTACVLPRAIYAGSLAEGHARYCHPCLIGVLQKWPGPCRPLRRHRAGSAELGIHVSVRVDMPADATIPARACVHLFCFGKSFGRILGAAAPV